MCGILGSVNRPFGEATLSLIRHRGPDDSAISQISIARKVVTLGHRRLSIVDLSAAGRQPMWTACGKHAIVFNGEVYNHLDLRDQMCPGRYRGHSDTETILNFVARYGIQSVSQFNGIFSFGFLDGEQEKLFLARDAFGVKPLYYWLERDTFLFSSELRPLLDLSDDTIDPGHLAELLQLRYLPSPDTLFKNIRKVRPGHVVEVDLRAPQLSLREYPYVGPVAREVAIQNRAEALEQYGVLVEKAIQRQLMSDVEIGLLLSGGIDSALIAGIAQRHSRYTMKAFTVGYSGNEDTDEIAQASETARIIGLEHHVVRIGLPEFVDFLPRISSVIEEPLATSSVIPMYRLSEMASDHVKVVLSGQGADEAMGGYRRYQTELLRAFAPSWALPCLRAGARLMNMRNETIRRGLGAIGETEDVRRFEAIYTVFNRTQTARLVGQQESAAAERIRYFYDLLGCVRQRHSAQRLMSIDLRMNLADDLLLYTDKITMHHSIECRVPFLDLELVRFAESLPLSCRLGILQGKLLHKRFAKTMLPSSIVQRKKNGFNSPTGSWFRSSMNVFRETLLNPRSHLANYFDLAEVKKVLDEHATGLNRERHIFLLLSIHHWMTAHFERMHSHPRATAVQG